MAKYNARILAQLNVGPKLQELRERKGLTRPELALKTGLHKQTIFQLEKIGKDPKLSTIYSYAYGLDISAARLMELLDKEEF